MPFRSTNIFLLKNFSARPVGLRKAPQTHVPSLADIVQIKFSLILGILGG